MAMDEDAQGESQRRRQAAAVLVHLLERRTLRRMTRLPCRPLYHPPIHPQPPRPHARPLPIQCEFPASCTGGAISAVARSLCAAAMDTEHVVRSSAV